MSQDQGNQEFFQLTNVPTQEDSSFYPVLTPPSAPPEEDYVYQEFEGDETINEPAQNDSLNQASTSGIPRRSSSRNSLRSSSRNSLRSSSRNSGEISTSPKPFSRIPSFGRIFQKSYDPSKKHTSTICKHCNWKSTTNEYGRLYGHILSCKSISEQDKDELKQDWDNNSKERLVDPLPGLESDRWNIALANVMIRKNIPFRLLEDKGFRDLIKEAAPGWVLVNRKQMSQRLLPNLSSECFKSFRAEEFREHELSIEFDYWKDYSHRSILGVLATRCDGSRHLIALTDVTGSPHTGRSTFDNLKGALHDIDPRRINSVVSDGASVCNLARSIMVRTKDFRHLIEHKCMAHFLNLIGKKFTESKIMSDTMSDANALTAKISINDYLCSKLSEAGLRRVTRPSAVRWYSSVNTLESLVEIRQEAISILEQSQNRDNSILEMMRDEEFWLYVEEGLIVLRPLANCIAVAERQDASLADAVRELLLFMRELFRKDWTNPFILAGIEATLAYFNPIKLGEASFSLMLATYVLDRRNKLDFVTPKGLELVLLGLLKLGAKTGMEKEMVKLGLAEDYPLFCSQRGKFGKRIGPSQSSRDWWEKVQGSGVLRILGMRLSNLKSSTANIERTFSIMRLIQGQVRTNLNVKTLEHLTRLKFQKKMEVEDQELISGMIETISPRFQSSIADDSDDEPQIPRKRSRVHQFVRRVRDTFNFSSSVEDQSDKLDQSIRDFFKSFSTFIDFEIVNNLIEEYDEESAVEVDDTDVAALLQAYRSKMSQT